MLMTTVLAAPYRIENPTNPQVDSSGIGPRRVIDSIPHPSNLMTFPAGRVVQAFDNAAALVG